MLELTQQQIEEIRKKPNNIHWAHISINYKLNKDFIIEFYDWLHFELLIHNPSITDDIIIFFKEDFMRIYCWYQNYSKIKFLIKNGAKLNNTLLKHLRRKR